MKNSDVGLVVMNANLLCSMENIPFKIARRTKDLGKIGESILTKLKEITDLGAEKQTPEEEIEAERKEFLEKEVDVNFDRCLLAWFDDIPNVEIYYQYAEEQSKRTANSHAIIELLIEKGFIV